jgi:hypothetical protein
MRAHVLPENFHGNENGKNYTMMLIPPATRQNAIFPGKMPWSRDDIILAQN